MSCVRWHLGPRASAGVPAGWRSCLKWFPEQSSSVALCRLEAIASRLEAIAGGLEGIASRLEAIAGRLEAIVSSVGGHR